MAEDKGFSAMAAGMMGLVGIVVAFTLIQALTTPPEGKAIVYGFVTDKLTGLPMPDVLVNLDGIVRYTASEGQYEIRNIAAGQTYKITFSKTGYHSITLDVTPSAGLNEINVEMELA